MDTIPRVSFSGSVAVASILLFSFAYVAPFGSEMAVNAQTGIFFTIGLSLFFWCQNVFAPHIRTERIRTAFWIKRIPSLVAMFGVLAAIYWGKTLGDDEVLLSEVYPWSYVLLYAALLWVGMCVAAPQLVRLIGPLVSLLPCIAGSMTLIVLFYPRF